MAAWWSGGSGGSGREGEEHATLNRGGSPVTSG
jgi:hypothetical protein